MEIFKGQNLMAFTEHFRTDQYGREFLSNINWFNGYVCSNCGHTKWQICKCFARTCNSSGNTESATGNTLFYKGKFGLINSFFFCFEMAMTTKSLSAFHAAVRLGAQEKTARMFMQKVREAMKRSGGFPMKGIVNGYEYVVGGYQKGQPVRSYDGPKQKGAFVLELADRVIVNRFYTFQILNYSARMLQTILCRRTGKGAKSTTRNWKGYNPIANKYDLTQILSDKERNFKALQVLIHQVKSWVITTYLWVCDNLIDRYFDMFCYPIIKSQFKDTIFNFLIKRRVKTYNSTHKERVCG